MDGQKLNILLVDDRVENLVALEAVLMSPHYNLVRANSGEEALKLILKEDFSLILLDVQMPGLDGFETAKLIRMRKRSHNIPIIFITAINHASEYVLKGYQIGATDYIIKPFHPDTLKFKVQGYLRVYQDRVSYEKITNILESISDAFISVDNNWQLTYINKEAVRIFHLSNNSLEGKSIWDLIPETIVPTLYEQLNEAINSKQRVNFELEIPEPQQLFCEVNAYPFFGGLSIYFRNVTEIKLLQKEMIKIDRLNTVGKVAAGIAHEVRNPMTTVRGLIQVLASKDENTKNNKYFPLMLDELDRANSIITNFLFLANDKHTQLKRQSLNKIIENLFPLIQADARVSEMDIYVELEEIKETLLDEEEIRQLIINLVRNGLQAMSPGGKLKIKTYTTKEEIVLVVQDDGNGIASEVLEKIGTPFFTTKNNGTGLGLAVCYSIAQRHHAKIDIETSARGTTVYVRFKY